MAIPQIGSNGCQPVTSAALPIKTATLVQQSVKHACRWLQG